MSFPHSALGFIFRGALSADQHPLVLMLTPLSGQASHMCRGTEDEHRWSHDAVGSGRSVKGDSYLRAQQIPGLSWCNLGATQIPPRISAEDLFLCFCTIFATKDQQLTRTAVEKTYFYRVHQLCCPRWHALTFGVKEHSHLGSADPPMACCDAQPALTDSRMLILTQYHLLMNFVFSFHLEETPTQSSTWCLEMVGLPIVGLL